MTENLQNLDIWGSKGVAKSVSAAHIPFDGEEA